MNLIKVRINGIAYKWLDIKGLLSIVLKWKVQQTKCFIISSKININAWIILQEMNLQKCLYINKYIDAYFYIMIIKLKNVLKFMNLKLSLVFVLQVINKMKIHYINLMVRVDLIILQIIRIFLCNKFKILSAIEFYFNSIAAQIANQR